VGKDAPEWTFAALGSYFRQMTPKRLLLIGGGIAVALTFPAGAASDVGLLLRKNAVRVGARMTVWGPCDRMPVYLVRDSYARRTGLYDVSQTVAQPPTSAPFRFLGRMVCTGRMHYIGDYPNGDWSSWNGYLRFRVPQLPACRYQFVIYCEPCHRGRGGSLIVSNWLWRGSKRIGRTALTVRT
jgi:hypothetical protein